MRGLQSVVFGVTVAVSMLLASASALAAPEATLSPSPAQRCLEPSESARAKPVYPADMLKLKVSATVDAAFIFTAPDRAPDVRLNGNAGSDFERSIKDYAEQLRVPCMGRGGVPIELKQSFDFVPNDGRKVAWTTPTDSANGARKNALSCLARPQGDDAEVRYPEKLMRERREGTLVARVRFVTSDGPPGVEILADGGDRAFRYPALGYLEHVRLPCISGGPIETLYYFKFVLNGGADRRVLQDVGLAAFLGSVKPIPSGSAYFDTGKMKCPFDVRLTFRQPFESNVVDELEDDVPERHAFLDWLAGQQLVIPGKASTDLLSQQMTIHIPCTKIDL